MDENKSRQSPGMADNQNGQARNMFSTQEAEEVKAFESSFVDWELIFSNYHLRWDNCFNSLSHSAIWYRQLRPAACHLGSGLAVHTWKTSAQCFSRRPSTSTRRRFTRKTTTSTTKSNRQRLNIRWTPTRLPTFFATFSKATTCCHGSQWTQILMIGFLVYQFMYKC